jgi:putative NIF3 family GTP cyclohydrolase 1 type 2
MTAREIYELAIRMGTAADPRGKSEVQKQLEKEKRQYGKLSKKEKEEFDREKLSNPYPDTRFLTGDLNKEVKRILVGIDIDVGEVLLADRLTEKGKEIDLIISHHPMGKALAVLDEAVHLQEEMMHRYGIPINVAEGILAKRIAEISRAVAPINHNRAVDAARLLGYSMLCIHTPMDNLVYQFIDRLINRRKPETVGDVVDTLKRVPEYKEAARHNAGPRIFVGDKNRKAGKIAPLEITGGTSGSKEMYEKLSQAGIGTIIGMHMGEEYKKEAEKYHINVVIAGHMASDSVGINLLLDEIEKKGKNKQSHIEIIPCSGLIRISRL